LRHRAALQNLGLARVSNPKTSCGPEGTLDEVEEFLRAKVPQRLEKPGGKRPKSR